MRVSSAVALAVVGVLSAATAVVSVGVQTTAATGLAVDTTVSAHQPAKTNSVTSPAFSTAQAGELLVAFAAADGPSPGAQAISTITGGGLTWQLARRTNTQAGTAEIWTATAPAVLKNATVKASYSGSYMGSLTVAAFSGAKTTIGATGTANSRTGAPSATLASTQAGSWVWGVGNDWDGGTARTPGAGQTKVDEYLASAGDTFWVQRRTSVGTGPAGTPVTLNDVAPTNHRWNLTTVEILPANGDTTAPTSPSGVTASAAGPRQATLTWTASTDAVGVVGYSVYRSATPGFTPAASNLVGTTGNVTTYSDNGLTPGTYYYSVTARDAAGNVSPASTQAAVTLLDATAPTAPTAVSATVSNAQVTLAWTASTDDVGVVGYSVYRSLTAGFAPDAGSLLGTSTTAGYVDMSVPAGTYYYAVSAQDAAGNTSSASTQATALVAPSDTVAPSTPGVPTFARAGAGQVAVSWTASTDDVGVAGYNVYRSATAAFQPNASSLVGTATPTTFTDTVGPGTYYYAVAAFDAAGNLSPASTATLIVTDTAAPTVPTNLAAKASSPTQVDLTWTASTDDVGVASYTVYRNGTPLATVTGTTYSNTGLVAGTAYAYSVAATDAAGNTSVQSPPVTVTTPAGTGATVVFDDEFNGTSVDPGLWSVGNRPGDASNAEKQCYKPGNVTESGGYLQINSKVDSSCSGYAYTSGMVQWNTFSYTYGTLEYRAKQPAGTGTWPAQWLLGGNCQAAFKTTAENTGGCNWPQPGSDEIDVSEFKSSTTVNWQNVISGNSGFLTCKPTVSNANTNWHIYQLVWKPGSLVWKVDGVTTCTQTTAVPSTPMFMIINTALGGGGGGTIKNSTLPQTMLVDYVKLTQ